jgi:hypothetical protein
MKRTVLIFATGLFLPLAVELATFGFFVQRFKRALNLGLHESAFIAMPIWPYLALPILGIAFVMWQLRPEPLKGAALAITYLVVFYAAVLLAEPAIMRMHGIFID